MYITRPQRTSANGKTYETVLLRESYREDGKVKNRTLANFTHCPPEDVAAIEFALKHKDHLAELASSTGPVTVRQGLSVGAAWVGYQVAQRLGLEAALGTDVPGRLALYQVLARLLEQGSRLSAVRLAQTQALPEVLGLTQGFCEDDLYDNLVWLTRHQEAVEQALFRHRRPARKSDSVPPPAELFLYDVTSSYLEGQYNELADYGYNRDGKKGKKQIVIGLLCDAEGEPVSVQVFRGNTSDVKTLSDPIRKAAQRFGCSRVTLVGDRGMIKSAGIEELTAQGFHYITAITQPQIRTLLRQGAIQLGLFDEVLAEVEQEGVRYILRRNPERQELLAQGRSDKQRVVQALADRQNAYLHEHPKAKEAVARRRVEAKIQRLKLSGWLRLSGADRTLQLESDEAALADASRLDGCYVLRTDVPKDEADKQTIHARYKDLSQVESAFRTGKTGHLELRPIHVRKEDSTRGHVLVVMLAYLLRRELERAWAHLDVTVEEGLRQLTTVCSVEWEIQGRGRCQQIPEPNESVQALLKVLDIRLPEALPPRRIKVVTKKKLPNQRLVS